MKRCLWLIGFVFLIVMSLKAQNDTVVFSAPGGFYEDVFSLELYNTQPQNHIRYTTNGNRPTAQSPLVHQLLVAFTDDGAVHGAHVFGSQSLDFGGQDIFEASGGLGY